MKSQEETVNLIRNRIHEAVAEIDEFCLKGEIRSTRLSRAAALMESVAVDFERLINSLPKEARS